MELIKSKGLAIFFIVVLTITVVSSLSIKNDGETKINNSYATMDNKNIL